VNRTLVLLALAFATTLLNPDHLDADESVRRIVQIGYVSAGSASTYGSYFSAFREQLKKLGYVEGRDLVIEARWADGHIDRLPALMAEAVKQKIDVIVTSATPGAMAAKNATSTIPIVGVAMGDPVRSGLAASLAGPGGNLTGLSMGYSEGMAGKWLELLQEMVPQLSTVAVIANTENPWERDRVKELAAIAAKRRLKVKLIEVREAEALDGAFEQARRQAQAVLVLANAVTLTHQRQITSLAAKHRIPAMYGARDFVDAGGLMAYASDLAVQYRRAADYVDKILKGAKPGELPIEQPTQFALVVNLKTAKALGLTIPQPILIRADEVIR
jgi:putative tryptophan/tyrosine transport system substrate-binding protein